MEDSGSKKKEKEVKMRRNSTRLLKAMLRKNWLLKIRHPFVTLTEVITSSSSLNISVFLVWDFCIFVF